MYFRVSPEQKDQCPNNIPNFLKCLIVLARKTGFCPTIPNLPPSVPSLLSMPTSMPRILFMSGKICSNPRNLEPESKKEIKRRYPFSVAHRNGLLRPCSRCARLLKKLFSIQPRENCVVQGPRKDHYPDDFRALKNV